GPSGARAHATDVRANPTRPIAMTRRRPWTSDSDPARRMSAPSVIMYASTTHCWSARPVTAPVVSSSEIAGSATLTTEPSRNDTNDARTATTSTRCCTVTDPPYDWILMAYRPGTGRRRDGCAAPTPLDTIPRGRYGARMTTTDTRARLVAAAQELFWAQGVGATSPRQVLAASGVGQGSLYHHFPTKHDLAAAAVHATTTAALDAARRDLDADGTAVARLVRYLERRRPALAGCRGRSEEQTSEIQSRGNLVCRLLLGQKKDDQ